MSFFGLTNNTEFRVVDLISGDEWTWSNDNFVRVDAFTHPVHILQVQYPESRTA